MDLIVAVNKLGYIGKAGVLPWYSKRDLFFFKQMTLNKKCLLGSTTYKTLPTLKNRELLVVGKEYLSLDEALSKQPDYIIGGAKIYESCMQYCNTLYISVINDNTIGDTKFPFHAITDRHSVFFNYFDTDNML